MVKPLAEAVDFERRRLIEQLLQMQGKTRDSGPREYERLADAAFRRILSALEPTPQPAPIAWLTTKTVRWLQDYVGPACATKTAVHNRPIKTDGGVPVGLVKERIADIDGTGTIKRARRVDMLEVWHKRGKLSSAAFNVAERLRNTVKGREAHSLLKLGAIKGLSIGYRTREAEQIGNERHLKEVDLWEISLVTFPMQAEAGVDAVKGLDAAMIASKSGDFSPLKKSVEEALRDAGFPSSPRRMPIISPMSRPSPPSTRRALGRPACHSMRAHRVWQRRQQPI